jgi:hypothetical protein
MKSGLRGLAKLDVGYSLSLFDFNALPKKQKVLKFSGLFVLNYF